MKILTLSLFVSLIAASGGTALTAATLVCQFATECIETEACAPTTYQTRITYKIPPGIEDGLDSRARWEDDSSDYKMTFFKKSGSSKGNWTDLEADASGHLVLNAQGDARYVYLSGNGPLLITYHGTCEATN